MLHEHVAEQRPGLRDRLGASKPRVWIYASFPAGPGGGNPAAVVVSREPIDPALAQAVAAVLSVPTTGFAVADEAAAEGPVSVRFFTPQQEIAACGHVTIAVANALVELGVWSLGEEVTVRAAGGDVPLRLFGDRVEMTQRLKVLEPAAVTWQEVERALVRVRPHPAFPLAVSGTGLRHLIVPLADVDALGEVALDSERIAALADRAGVETVCVFAAPADPVHRVRVRDLCAGIGAVEEPASGTTSAALALYLADHHGVTGDLVVEQGIEMGRPSRIEVTVTGSDHAIVGGRARRVVSGELELPGADSCSR